MPSPVAVAPAPNAPTAAPATVAKPVVPAPATPAEAEPTFEVTVDGKPTKLTRKQIERYAGKGAFADRTVSQTKEALKALKQREAELNERDGIWDDDEKLEAELLKRGKLDSLARKRLQAKLAEQEMTPEQRAIAERDAKIAELEGKSKAAEAERVKATQAESEKRLAAKLENDLAEACQRHGMELSSETFLALQPVARDFVEAGIPLDPDMMVETAKANIEESFTRLSKAVAGGLKGDALVKRLGADVVKEVLRFKAEEFRGGGPKKAAPSVAKPAAPSEWISPQDAMKKMRGIG